MKKRVDLKIWRKTANRKTGRFEIETANDSISFKKKTAKKRPMGGGEGGKSLGIPSGTDRGYKRTSTD